MFFVFENKDLLSCIKLNYVAFFLFIYSVYYLFILNRLAPTCVILCFNDDETTTFCEYIVLQTYFVKCVAHD